MSFLKIQESTALKVAVQLLKIQAIRLNTQKPFQWASGWKSPIYCDNRLSLSYPDIRKEIKEGLVEAIRNNFSSVEAIAGVATAGIAQGALVAEALELPFAYVRPKPKDHGMENLIEGRIEPGKKTVVVEDLISTGGSSLKAVQALRTAGIEVLGMVSIFTYGFTLAEQNFAQEKVSLVSLSDYEHLIGSAIDQQFVAEGDLKSLQAWRIDPANWKG
jgi:orotate phosphoribosyltransferase